MPQELITEGEDPASLTPRAKMACELILTRGGEDYLAEALDTGEEEYKVIDLAVARRLNFFTVIRKILGRHLLGLGPL